MASGKILLLATFLFYWVFPISTAITQCYGGDEEMDNDPGEVCKAACSDNPPKEKAVCVWEEDETGDIQWYGCMRIDVSKKDDGCEENPDGGIPWIWRCWCKGDYCNSHNKPNPLGNNPKATGNTGITAVSGNTCTAGGDTGSGDLDFCCQGIPGTKNMPGESKKCHDGWIPWQTVCYWQENGKGDIVKYGCKEVSRGPGGWDEGCGENPSNDGEWLWECHCRNRNNCNDRNQPNPTGSNPKAKMQGITGPRHSGVSGSKNPKVGIVFLSIAVAATWASHILKFEY